MSFNVKINIVIFSCKYFDTIIMKILILNKMWFTHVMQEHNTCDIFVPSNSYVDVITMLNQGHSWDILNAKKFK